MGNALPVPEAEVAEARKLYLARYANSKYSVRRLSISSTLLQENAHSVIRPPLAFALL